MKTEFMAGAEPWLANSEQGPAGQVERFISSQPPTRGIYNGTLEQDGVYVSPGAVSPEADLPQVVEVTLLPGALLGAGASHHQVMFGKVGFRQGEASAVVDAAIKPFTSGSGAAQHEHDCLIAAAERGFDTFEPLGLAKDGDTTYLLTRKRDELHTLDNENWTVSPSDTERYNREVVPNLRFMATTMGQMHARGLFHGDSAPRNYAQTDIGTPMLIDLESATLAGDAAEHSRLIGGAGRIEDSLAYLDATQGWYALTHHVDQATTNIFLEGESFDTCMAELHENYLEPYVASLVEHTPPDIMQGVDITELRTAIYRFAERTT